MINYSNRDFASIKAALLKNIETNFPTTFNDFYEDSSGVMFTEAFANVADLLSFYLDIAASNAFIKTANIRQSVSRLGETVGFRLHSVTPSLVALTGTLPAVQAGTVTLNEGQAVTVQKNGYSYTYTTVEDMHIPEGNIIGSANAVEGFFVTETFSLEGEPDQEITLGTKGASFDYATVTVNGEVWTESQFFIQEDETSKIYSLRLNENGYLVVTFGDGDLGMIPPQFGTVVIKYLIPSGVTGSISQGSINVDVTPDSHPSILMNLTNNTHSSGASDGMTIEKAKIAIPGHTRAVGRLFSKPDYIDNVGTYPGVDRIAVYTLEDTCVAGQYIRPWQVICYLTFEDGEPGNEAKLLEIFDWATERKNVGTDISIRNAEEVTIDIAGVIDFMPGAFKKNVILAAETALKTIFSKADIGESVPESLLISTIQTTSGVASVALTSGASDTIEQHQIAKLGKIELV